MMRFTLSILLIFLIFSGCKKESVCRQCGYYTGLSQKVDYIPGTTIGSYTTTTITHEVWRSGKGYTTAGFYYEPDKDGVYSDFPTEEEQLIKGYESLQVRLLNDTIWFDIRKPGGLSEVFEGRKAN